MSDQMKKSGNKITNLKKKASHNGLAEVDPSLPLNFKSTICLYNCFIPREILGQFDGIFYFVNLGAVNLSQSPSIRQKNHYLGSA